MWNHFFLPTSSLVHGWIFWMWKICSLPLLLYYIVEKCKPYCNRRCIIQSDFISKTNFRLHISDYRFYLNIGNGSQRIIRNIRHRLSSWITIFNLLGIQHQRFVNIFAKNLNLFIESTHCWDQWSYQDIRLVTQQVVPNFTTWPCLWR